MLRENEIEGVLASELDEERTSRWKDRYPVMMPRYKGLYMRCSIALARRSAVAASVTGMSREEWMRQLMIAEIARTLGDDPETLRLGSPPPRINEKDITMSRRLRYGSEPRTVSAVDSGGAGEGTRTS